MGLNILIQISSIWLLFNNIAYTKYILLDQSRKTAIVCIYFVVKRSVLVKVNIENRAKNI